MVSRLQCADQVLQIEPIMMSVKYHFCCLLNPSFDNLSHQQALLALPALKKYVACLQTHPGLESKTMLVQYVLWELVTSIISRSALLQLLSVLNENDTFNNILRITRIYCKTEDLSKYVNDVLCYIWNKRLVCYILYLY